jgi:phage head maturation protease
MSDDQSVVEQGEQIVFRASSFELPADGDGRTLYARIVPYNTPATVSDPPHYLPYQEGWRPEAFEKQLRASGTSGDRPVLLNFEHEPGIRGVIGRAVELVSRTDGLYGKFRILDGEDGDKALQLIRDKVLTGMSLEASATRSEMRNGVIWRTAARIKNAALARTGLQSYADAVVLAVRTDEPAPEPEPEPEPAPEEPEPVAVHSEVDDVLARIGYEPLVKRAVVNRPWDGSAARFEDDEYERSCIVCRPGDDSVKSRCSLPVLEPNGDLNVNGMHAAASRLNQTGLSMEAKAQAARKLIRYYRQADEEPPSALLAMAGR